MEPNYTARVILRFHDGTVGERIFENRATAELFVFLLPIDQYNGDAYARTIASARVEDGVTSAN